MKYLKTLVLCIAMCLGALGPHLALANPIPHSVPRAFEFACKVTGYDCTDVPMPQVIWQPLYNTYGILGGYDGGDAVYIDNSVMRWADPVFVNSILAHEITHYLDVQLGYAPREHTPVTVCMSEFNAWRVGNAYVISNGRPDLADFEWHIRYGCFQ